MSPEKKPTGSEDDVVTFEQIPELDPSDYQGSSAETIIEAGAGTTYKCPPGYDYDAEKKSCIKVKKEIAGPDEVDLIKVSEPLQMAGKKCPVGQELDEKTGKCVPVKQGQKDPYSCPAGEVWDDKKEKCVPVKEALAEKETTIQNLLVRVKQMEDQLRLKKIQEQVDGQIRAGHVAPVQREKIVSFMAGLPDDKIEDLTGIFSHQKFPLQSESGSQVVTPPGSEKAEIGGSESAEGLSPEDEQTLKEKFGISDLVRERGVKKEKVN